jgi:hypothetical protein
MAKPAVVLVALLLQAGSPAQGTITGRLLSPDGSPVAKARVSAQAVEERAGTEALISITETDDAGRFRLQAPAGRYVILAGRLDAPTYFPGVEKRAEARVLDLGAGQNIDGADFQVLASSIRLAGDARACAAGAECVAGQLVVVGGGPMPQSVEFNYHRGGCSFTCPTSVATAPVRPDGSFVIEIKQGPMVWERWGQVPESAVPQAAACPAVNPTFRNPASIQGSDDLLSRRAASCANLELRITFGTRGHSVSGRISGTDAAIASGASVRLFGVTGVPGTYPASINAASTVGADGSFTFSNVVRGAYRLWVSTSGGPSVAITVSDSDVAGIEAPAMPR